MHVLCQVDSIRKLSNSFSAGLLLDTGSSAIVLKDSRAETSPNPVLYKDYPDNDVSVGPDAAFFFSASTLRYHESNGLWYWIGYTNFWVTWVFTAKPVEDPSTNIANFGGRKCFNVLGQANASQLSADGFSAVKTEQVLQVSDVSTESLGAPVAWGADGYPEFVKGANGGWSSSYPPPLPLPLPRQPLYNWTRAPDVARFEVSNRVTHRIHGEFPRGSVEIGLSGAAADGDRFRLTALRDQTAYVGIHRTGSAYTLVAVQNITIDEWSGDAVARARTSSLAAPPGWTRHANFSYSSSTYPQHIRKQRTHGDLITMSHLMENMVFGVWEVIKSLITSHMADTLKTVWHDVTDEVWGDLMHRNSVISYLIDNTIMEVWCDFVDKALCPWYHPLGSLRQVLSPVVIFFWGILGGGTPSTFAGWFRTKYLLFFCRVFLRVDVLSNPFLDPMTEPYRGRLFDLAPREGGRPAILGLAPQRQGDQKAAPDTEAAMVAILERKAAENPTALVMERSLVEGHLRSLKRRLPAGLAPATPGTVAEWGGEVSHVHKLDSSAHVVLHPADCAEVIQKGWAERHPLGCAAENPVWVFWHHTICRKRLPLPHNIVLVYAPRDEAEMAMFERIVDAAAWFHTLPAPAEEA
ncbi:putative xylosidase glycosyl [Diaporthe ampelina]|uniref:Putative xylosidase glycosyl n=1 Tax=Diaporthe ampelina TaxID=1214573 RepID=A0A0G2FGK1_9PEZI|nr:putative xylosidase glycosyl [Diaporthe ampelina]